MDETEQEAGATLLVLTQGRADDAPPPEPSPPKKKPNASYAPITDELELSVLRSEGLTERGEDKVRKGDLRCRPSKRYREVLLKPKSLPQFRLSTVVNAAHAEDLVVLWAYLTGRDNNLKESELRFKATTYYKDAGLVKDLKGLPADADALMNYIKHRYGTMRQPKDDNAGGSGVPQQHVKKEKTEEQATASPAAVRRDGAAVAAEASKGLSGARSAPKKDLKTAENYIEDGMRHLATKGAVGKDANVVRPRAAAHGLATAAWDGNHELIAELAEAAGGANTPLLQDLTALHWAARGGVGPTARPAAPSISALLQAGAEVDARDTFGRTPLHYAARLGDVQAMTELLAAGADAAAAAKNGATPLHWAAEAGALDAVMFLLERGAGEYPPAANGNAPAPAPCGTALHWAARAGRVDVVNHLLVIAGFDPDTRDWNKTTPLHLAAAEWRETFPRPYWPSKEDPAKVKKRNTVRSEAFRKTMRLLAAHRADREAIDGDGRTPLHVAAARGNLSAVTFLLHLAHPASGGGGSGKAAAAAAAPKDSMGWDPLMLAVMGSDPSEAELGPADTPPQTAEDAGSRPLLDLFGKKEYEDNRDFRGRTALHLAVLEGNVAVARELLEVGAEADARDGGGATPLLLAARARHHACVEVLLAGGADPNAQDDLGGSALAAAARAGDCGCVEALLACGADVALCKAAAAEGVGSGRTPLHEAAEGGHADIVRRLLAQGAAPGAACAAGRTPLHEAARAGHLEIVTLLLAEDGVDVDAKDAEGHTPAALVPRNGGAEVLKALEAAGAAAVLSQPPSAQRTPAQLDVQQHATWGSHFALLNKFLEAQKRIPAPDEWHAGFPLGGWVELQREKIRWDECTETQLADIGCAGLVLKSWRAGALWIDWLRRVEGHLAATGALPSAFAAYMVSPNPETPDHAERAAEEAELGWWLRYQQARRLGGSLSAGQIAALEALPGWAWEDSKDRHRRRTMRAIAVGAFTERHKRLPAREEASLGMPVGRLLEVQRQARVWSDGIASEKKWGAAARREGPSFKENLSRWASAWRRRASAASPDLPPESSSFEANDPRLNSWMNTQRGWFAQGRLSGDAVRAVEAAAPPGFNWALPGPPGAPAMPWDEWMALLGGYVKEKGALPPFKAMVKGRPLGLWVATQLRLCALNKMKSKLRAQLEAFPGWKEAVQALKDAHGAAAAAAAAAPAKAPTPGGGGVDSPKSTMDMSAMDSDESERSDADGSVVPGGAVPPPAPAPVAAPQKPVHKPGRRRTAEHVPDAAEARQISRKRAAGLVRTPAEAADEVMVVASDEEATDDEDGHGGVVSVPAPAVLDGAPVFAAAAAGGPEPVTAATPGLPSDLLPAFKRAWGGEALTTAEVWSLLGWWKDQEAVTLGRGAPRSPAPGSLYFLDPTGRYKQDGLSWKKEVHSDLMIDKEPKIKCYYANQTPLPAEGGDGGALLQRRCFWEKAAKSVVIVQYLPTARTVGVKREAEEERGAGGDAAASRSQTASPAKKARVGPGPGAAARKMGPPAAVAAPQAQQPGANLAATFPAATTEQQTQVTAPSGAQSLPGPAPAPVWAAPSLLQSQPQSQPWLEPSASYPPALVSPLADAPVAPSAPIPSSQPAPVPLQAASAPPAFLPPPGTLPPHVAEQLRTIDPFTADKRSISQAFRALHGCSIGGPVMFWAQKEAFTGKTVPLDDMRFLFDMVRECVLEGRMEDAVSVIQDMMETHQQEKAGAAVAAVPAPAK